MAGFSSPLMPNSIKPVRSLDVTCRKCRYDLRGMTRDSLCPECGAPVEFSLRSDLIRHSNPAWTGRLHSGAVVVLLGLAVMIVGYVVRALNSRLRLVELLFPQLLILASSFIIATGFWLLTGPNPSGLGEDIYGKSRKFVRLAVSVGLIESCWVAAQRKILLPPDFSLSITIAVTICGVVGWLGNIAEIHFLSNLATRIRDSHLEEHARSLRNKLGIPLGIALSVSWCTRLQLALGFGMAVSRSILIPIDGVAMLFVLIYGTKYLLLINRFRKQLKAQAILARQLWTSAANL